uniref:START domain-containing protein n=1 Tax=Steinernema glaseri TaxID=37863 RepID=A0A1I7YFL2_9BILA
MFGIAEFLQDYSKDPKYRAVWQASSSTDTYLEPIEGNEEGTITSVEELTYVSFSLLVHDQAFQEKCGRSDLRA